MLEFLRRHSQTIMIVTVVVIISFMFWGSTKTGARPGDHAGDQTAFTIYGRDYSFEDLAKLKKVQEAAMVMQLSDFSRALSSYSTRIVDRSSQMPIEFVFNLLILRHELLRYGIQSSDTEIKEEYKQAPLFQGGRGFTPEMFEQHLSSFGLKNEEVYELIGDVVGWRKLKAVIAGNVVPPPQLAEEFYVSYYQTIKASQIAFKSDDFKKTVQVSDDEIKKYYDQKKDELKTAEKRSAEFVFFKKPEIPEKTTDEDRSSKLSAYSTTVNNFVTKLQGDKVDFAALAKEDKQEVKTVPLFEETEAPDPIKNKYSLATEIFHLTETHPISGPIEDTDGYYIARLLKVEPSRQKELKEVEAKIKDALADQKAQEAMMKAANDDRKKLETALQGGKKLEEAAKELNLTAEVLPEFTPIKPPTEATGGQEIASEARKTPAGKFIKPVQTGSGVALVYIVSKELRKQPESAETRQRIRTSLDTMVQEPIFQAWYGKRKDEAKLNADAVLRNGSSRG